jgi:hypothetical protein
MKKNYEHDKCLVCIRIELYRFAHKNALYCPNSFNPYLSEIGPTVFLCGATCTDYYYLLIAYIPEVDGVVGIYLPFLEHKLCCVVNSCNM